MSATHQDSPTKLEWLDARAAADVAEAEYRRLLGYPRGHTPGERALELAAWARQHYAEHGRPWIYVREVEVAVGETTVRLDGGEFSSPRLREQLRANGATRALVFAVSAGNACEAEARQRWLEAKPDEYFFLEIFGSAVVERLVAVAHARICEDAARDGFAALPHFSPGYGGWDVAEQVALFRLITRDGAGAFPEPLEVLPSGMLRPKKSLLGVVGLARTSAATAGLAGAPSVPCVNCGFSPCQYRRAAYRHEAAAMDSAVAASAAVEGAARYSVNPRALRKWARERVRVEPRGDGGLRAVFRFDGTTCSNMGRPLAFDYTLELGGAHDGHRILAAGCRPAAGDEGHAFMCAYLREGDALLRTVAMDSPSPGQTLAHALARDAAASPSGCLCDAPGRAHKWRLALESIHFALTQQNSLPS